MLKTGVSREVFYYHQLSLQSKLKTLIAKLFQSINDSFSQAHAQ